MKKQNAFRKEYYQSVCLFLLIVIAGSAFSQQDGEINVYLFKKDWTDAKDIKEATCFMQPVPINDTTYSCRFYNKFGAMVRQETFLDSMLTIPNGRFCWYDQNGMLDSTGLVYRGRKTGIWKYYNDNGEPTVVMVYSNGHIIEKRDCLKNECRDTTGKPVNLSSKEKAEQDVFTTDSLAEDRQFKQAGFGEPDSGKQWKEYLKKSISLPERFVRIIGIGSCTATVSFTVNTAGKTEDIYLTHSCEWSADNEVFNAVRNSPVWQAAERHGSKVDYSLQQEITFHPYRNKDSDSARKYGVYIGSQVPAKFPGGPEAWQRFLAKNLNKDVPLTYNAPVGAYTVLISFLVQKDGTVTELKAEKDPGYGTAKEAIRVFKKSPKWIPAAQDGVPVIYRQKQAMTFYVSQN